MSMNENYELLIPTDDGYKDVKKISIDGVNVWKRAIPNTKSGTVPLSIAPTRVKPLLEWSITGNTVQASGTYTSDTKSVTVIGIESDTNYAYFNLADFPNANVGDTITMAISGSNYNLAVKKIDSNYVYIENKVV